MGSLYFVDLRPLHSSLFFLKTVEVRSEEFNKPTSIRSE